MQILDKNSGHRTMSRTLRARATLVLACGMAPLLAAAQATPSAVLPQSQLQPSRTANLRVIVPAPASGATVEELGAAVGAGISNDCLKDQPATMAVVLNAADSFDPQTNLYAISALVGVVPTTQPVLPWPVDAYAMTRAIQAQTPALRKQAALETVRAAAINLCRVMATPKAAGDAASKPK